MSVMSTSEDLSSTGYDDDSESSEDCNQMKTRSAGAIGTSCIRKKMYNRKTRDIIDGFEFLAFNTFETLEEYDKKDMCLKRKLGLRERYLQKKTKIKNEGFDECDISGSSSEYVVSSMMSHYRPPTVMSSAVSDIMMSPTSSRSGDVLYRSGVKLEQIGMNKISETDENIQSRGISAGMKMECQDNICDMTNTTSTTEVSSDSDLKGSAEQQTDQQVITKSCSSSNEGSQLASGSNTKNASLGRLITKPYFQKINLSNSTSSSQDQPVKVEIIRSKVENKFILKAHCQEHKTPMCECVKKEVTEIFKSMGPSSFMPGGNHQGMTTIKIKIIQHESPNTSTDSTGSLNTSQYGSEKTEDGVSDVAKKNEETDIQSDERRRMVGTGMSSILSVNDPGMLSVDENLSTKKEFSEETGNEESIESQSSNVDGESRKSNADIESQVIDIESQVRLSEVHETGSQISNVDVESQTSNAVREFQMDSVTGGEPCAYEVVPEASPEHVDIPSKVGNIGENVMVVDEKSDQFAEEEIIDLPRSSIYNLRTCEKTNYFVNKDPLEPFDSDMSSTSTVDCVSSQTDPLKPVDSDESSSSIEFVSYQAPKKKLHRKLPYNKKPQHVTTKTEPREFHNFEFSESVSVPSKSKTRIIPTVVLPKLALGTVWAFVYCDQNEICVRLPAYGLSLSTTILRDIITVANSPSNEKTAVMFIKNVPAAIVSATEQLGVYGIPGINTHVVCGPCVAKTTGASDIQAEFENQIYLVNSSKVVPGQPLFQNIGKHQSTSAGHNFSSILNQASYCKQYLNKLPDSAQTAFRLSGSLITAPSPYSSKTSLPKKPDQNGLLQGSQQRRYRPIRPIMKPNMTTFSLPVQSKAPDSMPCASFVLNVDNSCTNLFLQDLFRLQPVNFTDDCRQNGFPRL